jgi:hypothetical protein
VRKRITKRKRLILEQLSSNPQKGVGLYREVRSYCQKQECTISYIPEYYIRSFNRTIKDSFQAVKASSLNLPSYFLFSDIYYELIESRLISFNFPKNKLKFYVIGNTCVAVVEVNKGSYCQIAQKRIRRDIRFIYNDTISSDVDIVTWSKRANLGIDSYYISSMGEKTPISKEDSIKTTSSSDVFMEEEDLFICVRNANFVGFS